MWAAEEAFAEAVARARDDGHENELLSPPFTDKNVVSYLVRAWDLAKKIRMLSSHQPLLHISNISTVFYYL